MPANDTTKMTVKIAFQIHIDKTIGVAICPELGLGCSWEHFKDFLTIWWKNKNVKSSVKGSLPKIKSIIPNTKMISSLWNEAEPVDALESSEVKSCIKELRLPVREYRQDLLAKFEARIRKNPPKKKGGEDASLELLFPVRYIDGRLIGIRRIYWSKENNELVEENVPLSTPVTNESISLSTFPHGLHSVHQAHAKSIVLVASILDSISLIGNSPNGSIYPVAIADGTLTLPPEHLPFLENLSITFWFPDDVNSVDAVRTFAKKLGEQRCQVVTRDSPQPWIWSKKNKDQDVLEFIRHHARTCSHEYITTFESLRENVFLELTNHDEVCGVQWKRFDGFNDNLKGFRRGELTVFTGRTGAGKTTFLSEYSLDLCAQNVTTLWGSFEVNNVRLAKMQLQQFSGMNLEDNIEQFNKWADRFQKLPMYYLTFHGAHDVSMMIMMCNFVELL